MLNRRPEQTRRRIAQTASRLHSLVHPAAVAPDELLVSERTGRISREEAQGLAYRPAEIGERFGPQWATYWFRLAATVPEAWAGRPVELVWDSGCESTLYRGGAPVQGLVSGGGHDRTTAPLGTPSGRVELELELACNDLMGLPDPFPWRRDRTGRTWEEATDDRSLRAPRSPARLARAGLALLDPEAWELAWDFEVLRQLVAEPGLEPAWAGRLLAELDRFARTFLAADRATWPEARAILADLLAHRNAGSAHDVTAIGHAHIDTAWLWPLAETRRKLVRSWSSQLALMDALPRAPLRRLLRAALRVAGAGRAGALRASVRARAGGPLGGRSAARGSSPTQPALRRVAGAPAALRPARLAAALRRALPRVLDARHVRLQRPGPADPARRRDRPLPHPEALLEPVHAAAAPLVRLGGRRRLAGAGAHAAGRHLQRRGHGRRAARERRPASRTTTARRRACSCSATATVAAGRPPGCSSWRARGGTCRASRACSSRRPPSSSTGSRTTSAIRGRSSASSTSSTTAAPTRARRGPSAATAPASGCCERPRPRRRSRSGSGAPSTPPRSCARCG